MFALWSDPEVCRHSGPIRDVEGRRIPSPVHDSSQSDRIIAFWTRAHSEGRGLRWAICDRVSGEFLGATGFNSLGECAEYAYHLRPPYWRQGVMTEATGAALRWIRATGCSQVEAFIEVANANSVRFAERLGFRHTGETTDTTMRFLLSLDDRVLSDT